VEGAEGSTFNTQAQAAKKGKGARTEVEWYEEPLDKIAQKT
jgi:hypothetical protein